MTKKNLNSFLFRLFGFQKPNSSVHIIVIILIHSAAWCLFLLLPLLFYPIRFSDTRFLYIELLSKLLPISIFYLNYYYLLPRFFERRKFVAYFSSVFAAILLVAAQEIVIRSNNMPSKGIRFFKIAMERPVIDTLGPPRDHLFIIRNNNDSEDVSFTPAFHSRIDSAGRPFPEPFRERRLFGMPRGVIFMTANRAISLCVVLLLISGLMRLGHSFLKNQNEIKALENAHLNAEVNFLKSQINPHFLFNTLNVIYSQAHAKSENTEYSILKLSDLLRYVLYDSGENKVELTKDIQYLSNYVDLQRLRISQRIKVKYEISGSTEGKYIAPLLLITFVENAFKHGISYTNPSTITISIGIFEKTLTLLVSNPVTKTNSFADGGLGLKNVTRRLDLLYPGNYLLDTVYNDHLYIVNLKINLDSD